MPSRKINFLLGFLYADNTNDYRCELNPFLFLRGGQMNMFGTTQIGRMLGIAPHRIYAAVARGDLPTPVIGPARAFLWDRNGIEKVSQYFRNRSADDLFSPQASNGSSMIAVA